MRQNNNIDGVLKPVVSIGLPVYNGENYLSRAIESVLAQTYTNFELVICDNASTDSTQEICQFYAAQDPRIRYIRHDINRGATANFNFAFRQSEGMYFNWLAHDDEFSPSYVEQCVSILSSNLDVVLCFSRVRMIDENSNELGEFDVELRTHSTQVSQRFYDLLMVWHDCLPVFGLIRADALRKTDLIGDYSLGDAVLLARLGLHGRFLKIPEPLFYSRKHALQSNKKFNIWIDHHAYDRWFAPTRIERFYLPQWKVLFNFFSMVHHAEMSMIERAACNLAVLRWSIRYRKLLLKDWLLMLKKHFSPATTIHDTTTSSQDRPRLWPRFLPTGKKSDTARNNGNPTT